VRQVSSLVKRLEQRLDPNLWGFMARTVIEGLTGARPNFYEGLTGSGEDFRNFSAMKDIRATTEFLDQLSNSVLFISELVDIPVEIESYLKRNAPIQEWGLDHLFATALVRRILTGAWEVIPVTGDELKMVRDVIGEGMVPPGDVQNELDEMIGRMVDVAGGEFGEVARDLSVEPLEGCFPSFVTWPPGISTPVSSAESSPRSARRRIRWKNKPRPVVVTTLSRITVVGGNRDAQ
jgi:hypothetical protein